MLVFLGLLYIFAIYFVSGFGLAYYIFKRTQFGRYFFLFAPLVGICVTSATLLLFSSTGLPFSFLILLALITGVLVSLLVLWRGRGSIVHQKANALKFCLILFFAILAGTLAILPHILTNQYGYFHFGNDELMYYSGRTVSVMKNTLAQAKVEQFDRFGTLLFLATISYYLHQAPPLIVQIAQGVGRMNFVFVCFGVAQFLRTIIFKRKDLGIVETVLLGIVLLFSAVEYEHFTLDYLAAQTNMGIFLMFLLLILFPSLLHTRKLAIFFSLLLVVLIISYPEMGLLIGALVVGSLGLRVGAYALTNWRAFGGRSFFTKQVGRTIISWLFWVIWSVFLLFALSEKNGFWMYFNYAGLNSVNYAIGGSVLGDPRTNLPQFLARIMGMQFLDFMPVNTLPGYALVILGICYIFLLILWYGKLARVSGWGILIIPICFLYVTIKGGQTGNFYQLAKMVFYLNGFTLLLWLSVKHKPRLQIFSLLFLFIIVIGNATAIYRHVKYYVIQQIPVQFFSAAQVDTLKKEIGERQYTGVVVNSSWYAMWEFFYQNNLPIQKNIIQDQVFVETLYEFVKKPDNTLFITFPHWANRFLNTSSGEQKLGSVWLLRPEIFQDTVDLLPLDQTKSIQNKADLLVLDDGKIVILCNTGKEAEVTQVITSTKLKRKLLFVTTNVSSEPANTARIQLTDLTTGETVKSHLYTKAGFGIDSSLPEETLLQTILENTKYMQRLAISYRAQEKTEAVSLTYVVSGTKPGCAVFKDTDILEISRL